ncbi:MAG: winged helix-turn-helix transcriptional regulator [Thermodesulfobacteriota bacterium]
MENYSALFKPSEEMRDLQFLEEIEQNPKISQRELSHKFGIALGVTNACIHRMVRRGLIRLKGFPPRRIVYYLTPKGFARKSKLMLHSFANNIHHYAEMKKVISRRLLEMQENGVKRVVFFGVGDEMEVAYITLQGLEMKLVGIGDREKNIGKKFFGYKVIGLREVSHLNPDGILIFSNRNRNTFGKTFAKQKEWNSIKIFTI